MPSKNMWREGVSVEKIQFITEPGYLYDLIFIFVFYFNKEYCLSNFIDRSRESEEKDFLAKVEEEFGPVPDELLLFFYAKNNASSFIAQYCFEAHENEFLQGYNFSTIQNDLADYQQVEAALLKYYFEDLTEREVDQCLHSVVAAGRLILNSSYSGELKSSLYAFILEPGYMVQKLSNELMRKELLLAQWREKNMKKILDLEHQVDFQKLSLEFKQYQIQTIDISSFPKLYISPCTVFKNGVNAHFYVSEALLLLGVDYSRYWQYLISQKQGPKLHVFGNAIAEENRIDILNMMLERGEVTIRDLEQKLGLTGTNAYYHLSLMIKANMLRTRNQGRTVLYSLNPYCFEAACDMLHQYSGRGGKKE